jgi:hypothetical protein
MNYANFDTLKPEKKRFGRAMQKGLKEIKILVSLNSDTYTHTTTLIIG